MVATPIFGSVIFLDRFESVHRFQHFINGTSKGISEGPPKHMKICCITKHPNSNLRTLYFPQEGILIDELLTFWKAAYPSNSTFH
jgi:hypothetical protein